MKTLLLPMVVSMGLLLNAQTASENLTQELQALSETSELPGFAVSVVSADAIHYQQGFGFANRRTETPFTPATRLGVGSVTKTLTGVAIVQLISSGKIDRENPINDYLPFEIVNPYHSESPILVKHLLDHSSSIRDGKNYGQAYLFDEANDNSSVEGIHGGFLGFLKSHEPLGLEDFIRETLVPKGRWYKKKNFLKAVPGTENSYSNLNAAIAGLLVEKVSGQSFQEYTTENIFAPLGLNNSVWSINAEEKDLFAEYYFPSKLIVPRYYLATYPDGGWITNTADLSTYLQDMIAGYIGETGLLSQESYQMLLPGDVDDQRAFWGMGSKSRDIGHTGSDPGVHCEMRFNADSKIGIVIMTNVNAEDNETLWTQFLEIKKTVQAFANTLE